jgi:hypothetical protein
LRRDPFGSATIEDGSSWEELAESRLALALTSARACKTGESAGFSLTEAAQASEVVIVGDRIPEATAEALQVAGCRVNRLTGTGYALVDSFTAADCANAAPLVIEATPPQSVASDSVSATKKSLGHYVLFGPPAQPSTLANYLMAQEYLLAFDPCFGFAVGEASHADMVTIIADAATVSREIEESLRRGGAAVQRISGSIGQIAAELADRIAAGRPLV